MKVSKSIFSCLLTIFFVTISSTAFAQGEEYSYAFIEVNGKAFSKKLKVNVDFGETPEQIKKGQEYSEILTNKKSYAAILNYMVENDFELVETLEYIVTSQGTGGTSGIVFIMRKKKASSDNGSETN